MAVSEAFLTRIADTGDVVFALRPTLDSLFSRRKTHEFTKIGMLIARDGDLHVATSSFWRGVYITPFNKWAQYNWITKVGHLSLSQRRRKLMEHTAFSLISHPITATELVYQALFSAGITPISPSIEHIYLARIGKAFAINHIYTA